MRSGGGGGCGDNRGGREVEEVWRPRVLSEVFSAAL
jgi:hypothetical protein